MRWYDTWAIFAATVLALWADYDAGRAMRGSILAYLATVQDARWVRSVELRQIFGPSVYSHLRALVKTGLLETQTSPGGPERGQRDDYFYRQKR